MFSCTKAGTLDSLILCTDTTERVSCPPVQSPKLVYWEKESDMTRGALPLCAEDDNEEEEEERASYRVQVQSFSLKSTQKCDVSNRHSCEISV